MSTVPENKPEGFAKRANANHLLIDSLTEDGYPEPKAGDFQYEPKPGGAQAYFWLLCPKCGTLSGMAIRPIVDSGVTESWELSGTLDRPTLRPSIDHKGCWHGWLTNGEFSEA